MAKIEQPSFDELAVGDLSEVFERGDAHIEDAHYKGIARLGVSVGTYYASLREMDVPPKHALKLTREWMHICSWGE